MKKCPFGAEKSKKRREEAKDPKALASRCLINLIEGKKL